MRSDKYLKILSALALLIVVSFSGCRQDDDITDDEPPIDGDPQITVVDPTNGLALLEVGESITITFESFDNELLNTFFVSTSLTSVNGVVVQADTEYPGSRSSISTTNYEKQFTYTVPNVQVFTTIKICGHAIDNKGKEAVACFTISVIPPPDAGTIYPIQDYANVPEDDTIWSIYTGHNYYFNLINREYGDPSSLPPTGTTINDVDAHIAEVSPAGGASFRGIFESPAQFSNDSILVKTNEQVFNFDSLTYQTIYQAFITSNEIGMTAGDPLNPGDIVLLKMPQTVHYAAIRILERNVAGGFIVFDYKYTHD